MTAKREITASRPKKARETQSSRTEAMRLRLFNSAIEVLYDRGYAAASTTEILRRAKVSRGAMLHHFPTKVDLMLATASHILDLQTKWYHQQLAEIDDPRERFIGVTAIAWRALREPTGMALLEILMATRSDPELGRRFPVVGREIERVHEEEMWLLAKDIGLTNRRSVKQMIDVVLGAMRGLSIQLLFADDDRQVEHAMEMLIDWKRQWLDRVLPPTRAS